MSTSSKRGRACVACASIKIKCQLGSDTSLQPPCERCVRLNKDCVLSVPKRQKDRVAELEAQVANLTRILREQGIDAPGVSGVDQDSTTSPTARTTAYNSKKRRLDGSIYVPNEPLTPLPTTPSTVAQQETFGTAESARLDQILSRELQLRLLNKYLDEMVPTFPLVPIHGDCSLDGLRKDRPILLEAIMYAACSGILSLDAQEDIARLLLTHLGNSVPAQGQLEIIQAMQITCIWYRTPRHHKHIAVYQLIQMMSGLASGVDICGPFTFDSIPAHADANAQTLDTTECWRAWLLSHAMSEDMRMFLRQGTPTPWSENHEQCLLYLSSSVVGLKGDRWLSSFLRAERLVSQISELLEFNNFYECHDVSEPGIKTKIQTCRNWILNWRVSTPQALRTPLILFWEHLATAHMFEMILHTPTNKQTFAAPYVSERLSLTDVPKPMITPEAITAVYELISATHTMINIFTSFDASILMALGGLMVASRAAYANYILAKLYIATTIPGNTLGSVVDPTFLQVEEYTDKLIDAANRVSSIDVRCSAARILGSAGRIREWYDSYHADLYSPDGLLGATNGLQFDASTGIPTATSPNQKAAEWESFFKFSDSAADFGLDILFAEPLPGPFLFNDPISPDLLLQSPK